ncbi:murein biosynthesis integral membrane protein MurJ [Leifsonia aquatica]|uniref:murein biosynthesis integral membrane protein MurJ n=1 Tax=Leifsonia aquatica TaxID=144185 RepID=UPI00384EA11F
MAFATLASRFLGFLRSFLLVLLIGGTASSAGGQVYAVANELPVNLYNLFAGGVLGAVLVPQVVAAVKAGGGHRHALDQLTTLAIGGGFVLTCLLMLCAPHLIVIYAASWPADWRELATAMALWCMPQVFLMVVAAVLGQILNAQELFTAPAWAPVLSNAAAVAGLGAFFVAFGPRLGGVASWHPAMVMTLCGSATLASGAQVIMLWIALRRSGFRLRWRLGVAGLRSPGGMAAWVVGGVVAGQLGYVVVSNVCSAAGNALNSNGIDGASLNTLSTAYLIYLLPHAVIAVSLATAAFSRVSHLAVEGRLAAVSGVVNDVVTRSYGLILAAATVLIVISPGLSELLWGDDQIGIIASALAVGLVGFSQMYICNRVSLALGDGRSVFVTNAMVAILTALGAAAASLLAPSAVVLAVAASTAASNLLGWALSVRLLRRRFRLAGVELKLPHAVVRQRWVLLAVAVIGCAAGIVAAIWTSDSGGTLALVIRPVALSLVAGAPFVVYALVARVRLR